jgi:hypothetical protein
VAPPVTRPDKNSSIQQSAVTLHRLAALCFTRVPLTMHGRRSKKNCAVVAGFRRPFRFNNMNRHKQQTPEKPKQKPNLKQEKKNPCKLNNQ